MQYVLDAIADYLEDLEFTNILLDYATETNSRDFEGKSRILLMSNANSSQGLNTSTQYFNFTVYVRDANRATARETAYSVYNALQNAFFKSTATNGVTIHQITGNPPYFWGLQPQKVNMSEFAINMTALINNDDANLTNF